MKKYEQEIISYNEFFGQDCLPIITAYRISLEMNSIDEIRKNIVESPLYDEPSHKEGIVIGTMLEDCLHLASCMEPNVPCLNNYIGK